jgi:hypothetical protein
MLPRIFGRFMQGNIQSERTTVSALASPSSATSWSSIAERFMRKSEGHGKGAIARRQAADRPAGIAVPGQGRSGAPARRRGRVNGWRRRGGWADSAHHGRHVVRPAEWPAEWLAAFVAGCVLLVAPLAHATPPDPGWIAGYWDDADADHAISLVASCVGTINVQCGDTRRSAIGAGLAIDRDPGPHLPPRPSVASTRAPPDA